jgi:acyl-homoserine lactone acylase PvdQ
MIARFWAVLASVAIAGGCATRELTPAPGPHRVALYRDTWGAPHVYARLQDDGFYGLGYAVAEDNLEALLRVYLELSGRAASVFGPEAIEGDAAARLWRVAEDAQAGFARLPTQVQAAHRAFIAGVQRFMRDHPERTPAWAPQLAEWMPLASTHSFNLFLSVFQRGQGFEDCGVRAEVARFRTAWLETARSAASNQWVIAPSRTASHATIVWADSHSSFSFARDEVRLHAGGLHVSGILPLGMALPLIAHNNDLAWAYTAGGPDVSDCYRIETDPDDPERYRYDSEWRRLRRVTATIEVAGSSPVQRVLEYSEHNGRLNPIIVRSGATAFAVSSAYAGEAAIGDSQLYAMLRARTIGEFAAAHETLGLFPENVMAADRHGSTYYVNFGRVPKRDGAYAWNAAISGNTSATQWRGYHPLSDLIQARDPAAGWMRNTNNAPDTTIAALLSEAPAYVFNDSAGRNNERGARSAALIAADSEITIEDALRIGLDELWPHTEAFQASLRRALEVNDLDAPTPAGRQTLERLLAFDGHARHSSREALAWYAWREALRERVRTSGADPREFESAVLDGKPLSVTQAAQMVAAAGDAADTLQNRYGGMESVFGDVFRIGRGAIDLPLGGVRVPTLTGSEATLRAFSCTWNAERSRCRADSGQRHPMLTVFGASLQSWSAVPFGQSARAVSPHYSDQSRLASVAQLKPTYFDWRELSRHVVSSLILDRQP